MTWTAVGNFQISTEWIFTPPVEGKLFRLRCLDLQPVQVLIKQAQIIFDQQEFWGAQRLVIDQGFSLFVMAPPSFFAARRIALQIADLNGSRTPKTVQLEVNPDMPLTNPTTGQARSSTAASTTVASSATSVSLLAANANRQGATVWNSSTATLFLDFDSAATTADHALKVDPGGYVEVPFGFTGAISGVWSAVNGNALVREFS